ncbi:MAG: DEAD/DEAH box helicase [Deltaproteobacteria bacterium]|nr:MAG: DEAD/DEAH box helicase [Deltaproteobacteria bacterium]
MDVSFINTLLSPGNFLLMLAPPGWGKTRILRSLYSEFDRKIIFISPLKALAMEFAEASEELGNILYISKRSERGKLHQFIKKRKALLVLTPEMMDENYFLELSSLGEKYLLVLDEFHLFYFWGWDFRPLLWESAMGLAETGIAILGLSATFGDEWIEQWQKDFKNSQENLILINLGNQVLKNHPIHIYKLPFKNMFMRRFFFEMQGEGVILYFCKYRSEVDFYVEYFTLRGVDVLGCKGGEVAHFVKNLKKMPNPQCIFATSALSHGVNLPSIKKIFIGFKVLDLNFWIQMVGRGGRRGEPFELFHQDKFAGQFKLRVFLFDFYLRLINLLKL